MWLSQPLHCPRDTVLSSFPICASPLFLWNKHFAWLVKRHPENVLLSVHLCYGKCEAHYLAHPLSFLFSHSKVSQYKYFTCQYFYLHLYVLTFFFNYYITHVFTCIKIFICKCFYMRCRCMAKPKLSAGVLGLKVASPIFCCSFHFVKSMLSPSLLSTLPPLDLFQCHFSLTFFWSWHSQASISTF